MSSNCTVKFRIFEPMMFRGPGEFDPSARGLQARAVSLMLPSPSTIAGTLSTVLLEKGLLHPNKIEEDWTKKYLSILGPDVLIRCPFLSANNKFYVEDRIISALLPIEDISLKAKLILEAILDSDSNASDIVKKLQILEENIENLKDKLNIKTISMSEKVGIGLGVRNEAKKVVKKGFIYSESMVDYIELGYPIEVLGDISGQICKKFNEKSLRVPVRFGGEGRLSLMEISGKTEALNEIRHHIWRKKMRFTGELALYLASPALFRCGDTLIERVKKWGESKGLEFIYLYGETQILGGGYSLDIRRRKPLYTALKPGSIIFMKVRECDLVELYWKGVGESGVPIGYGTIIPVPID